MNKKRWKVTQYGQPSELGSLIFEHARKEPVETCSKTYRWKWRADLSAWINRGESAGLGLRVYTTTVVDLWEHE